MKVALKRNTLYVATHIANRKCVDINIGETFYSHSTQELYLYHKKQTYTLMISCSTSVEIRPFNTKFPGAIPQCIFYILKRWSFNRYLRIFAGDRLANVIVGATDLNPSDRENMVLSELIFDRCGFHPGPIPNGATHRFNCPPGNVTGRYLVVQLNGTNFLTLCEVTATGGRR